MEGYKHKMHTPSQRKDSVNHSSYSISTVAQFATLHAFWESVLQVQSLPALYVKYFIIKK